MGVVIEICTKYPGGRTWKTVTDMYTHVCTCICTCMCINTWLHTCTHTHIVHHSCMYMHTRAHCVGEGRCQEGSTEERKDLGMKAPFAFLPCPFWTEGLKDRKFTQWGRQAEKKNRRQARRQVATHKRQPTFQKCAHGAHGALQKCRTSTAFLKGKACSTGFLDKTIWNPRPVIDLLSRAVFESGVSFLHFLGPTLVRFWRFSALLTGAVGIL